MKGLLHQTYIEVRLQLRRREVLVFTLLLPVLFLIFFGALYGSQKQHGVSYIDYIVPGYAVFAVMAVALGTLSSNIAFEREFKILKRLGGTPLPRLYLLLAKIIAGALLAGAVIAVLLLFGTFAFHAHLHGNILGSLAVLAVGVLSFAAIGIAIGGTVKPDSAVAVGNLIYLALSFLGGVFIQLDQFPSGLLTVARFLPSEHMVHAMQSMWTFGEGLNQVGGDLLVTAAWGAAAVIFGARRFRWM